MATTARKTLGQRFVALANRIDDGQILRAAFYALLVGTVAVVAVDWTEMQNAATPAYDPQSTPIPPGVSRPEIDPDNPAYNPGTELTTDPALLREPMTISLQPGGTLLLEGVIQPGSAEQLAIELGARSEYVDQVALNSPGGVVQEALQMGRMIRQGGFNTSVAAGALCASSCPLIFAAGVERIIQTGSAVGVHQIYTGEIAAGQSAQALSDAQATTAAIARYLSDMGIDQSVWLHALETPPDSLYYFTADEMVEYNLATNSP